MQREFLTFAFGIQCWGAKREQTNSPGLSFKSKGLKIDWAYHVYTGKLTYQMWLRRGGEHVVSARVLLRLLFSVFVRRKVVRLVLRHQSRTHRVSPNEKYGNQIQLVKHIILTQASIRRGCATYLDKGGSIRKAGSFLDFFKTGFIRSSF
jgi:hypothetical protein